MVCSLTSEEWKAMQMRENAMKIESKSRQQELPNTNIPYLITYILRHPRGRMIVLVKNN